AGEAIFGWAERGLHTRGGSIIVTARFIPGGRTATSLTSGMIGYPRPRFIAFCLLAGLAWAVFIIGIGMAGGYVFQERPLLGVLLGVGLALVLSTLIGHLQNRRTARSAEGLERSSSSEARV